MVKTVRKAKKPSKTDEVLTLFQNKMFTLIFFLTTFSLVGGALYLWKSSAATTGVRVSFSGCTVSYSGSNDNSVRVVARSNLGTVGASPWIGGRTTSGHFKIKARQGTKVDIFAEFAIGGIYRKYYSGATVTANC